MSLVIDEINFQNEISEDIFPIKKLAEDDHNIRRERVMTEETPLVSAVIELDLLKTKSLLSAGHTINELIEYQKKNYPGDTILTAIFRKYPYPAPQSDYASFDVANFKIKRQLEEKYLEMCEFLFSYPELSTLIDGSNQHGNYPLLCAMMRGYKNVVRLLLKHNANTEQLLKYRFNEYFPTILHAIAIRQPYFEEMPTQTGDSILEMVLSFPRMVELIDVHNPYMETPLLVVLEECRKAMQKMETYHQDLATQIAVRRAFHFTMKILLKHEPRHSKALLYYPGYAIEIFLGNIQEMIEALAESIAACTTLPDIGADFQRRQRTVYEQYFIEPLFNYRNTNDNDNTLLMMTVMKGSYYGIHLLLRLLKACKNREEAWKYIVDCKNRNGESAISMATNNGYFAIFAMLIANIRPKSRAEQELFELLINKTNDRGCSVLVEALVRGHAHIVKYILENCNYTLQKLAGFRNPMNHFHALQIAIQTHSLEGVKYILSHPEFEHLVDFFVEETPPPLLLAICEDQSNIVRLLINSGANIDIEDVSFYSKHDFKPKTGSSHWPWSLQVIYIPPTTRDEILKARFGRLNSYTVFAAAEALFWQLGEGRFVPVCRVERWDDGTTPDRRDWKILLEAGASLRQRGNSGHTPLHLAVQNGFDEWVPSFCEYDADLFAVNNQGLTALQLVENLLANETQSNCTRTWAYVSEFDEYQGYGQYLSSYNESISHLCFYHAKKEQEENRFEAASIFIMKGLLALASSKKTDNDLYPEIKNKKYFRFAKLIQEESQLVKILGMETIIAILKKITKDNRRIYGAEEPIYGGAQLELAKICYMAHSYSTENSLGLEGSEEELVIAKVQGEDCSIALMQKFNEFCELDETYLTPMGLLRNAYLHICEASNAANDAATGPKKDIAKDHELSRWRKEIIGSLLGKGMHENNLDLQLPVDSLRFIEQFKELSKEFLLQAEKLKAKDDRILALEKEIQQLKLGKPLLEDSVPGIAELDITTTSRQDMSIDLQMSKQLSSKQEKGFSVRKFS